MRDSSIGSCIIMVMLMLMPPVVGQASGQSRSLRGQQIRSEAINAALGLRRSRLVSIGLPTRAGSGLRLRVPLDGTVTTLNLIPHSLRAPGYQLLMQVEDGSIVPIVPGPERTMRGTVEGVEGSRVAVSWLEDGLHANIDLGDGRRFWIEPTVRHLADTHGAARNEHVIYTDKDVLPSGGMCGTSDKLAAEQLLPFADLEAGGMTKAAAGSPCIAELACDADVEYYIDQGSDVLATEAAITTIINNVNIQYERDVDITHQITTIIVRTGNRNSDPYTTNNPTDLLCEFITEWTNNQTGIQRDVAQLFTGRTIQAGTIGIAADLGDIGNNDGSCTCHPLFGSDGSYSLVQNIGGGDGCRSDLSAHELGHLWGAVHCSCSNPDFTMNSSITCANVFSASSQFLINTFKSSRTTLGGPCAGAPITNDVCAGATDIVEGLFNDSTLGVGTECPALPIACDEGAGDNLEFLWDIWYRYTASCTGDATVSLCGSNYDARLVVYHDNGCPPQDADLAACDDDFCGPGSGSQVTFAVVAGASYMVRVGGFGDAGNVVMNVSCDGVFPCPSDSNGDTMVDVLDLIDLLAAWGACPGCPEDSNNDGAVDVLDLIDLLAAWGACS